MLDVEARWREVWAFLSLDRTRPFFQELWIPIGDPPGFQFAMREIHRHWITREEYYTQYGAVHNLLAAWYQKRYGHDYLDMLVRWAQDIFVEEGPDRLAETVWGTIPFKLPPEFDTSYPLPGWIFEIMDTLRNEMRSRLTMLEEKIASEFAGIMSEWDVNMLRNHYESTADALITKIKLIGRYNIFLKMWEEHCGRLDHEKLFEIYGWGKHVASQIGMQDLPVCFPGNWRFEVRPILQAVGVWAG